jgi:SNF2 family DNA or RNA helicase
MSTLELTADHRLRLRCTYDERELAKQIPGASWNKDERAWYYVFSPERVDLFKRYFPTGRYTQNTSKQTERKDSELEKKLLELKGLQTCELALPHLKEQLREHQKLGVKYLLHLDCAMLADQMGNGKSLQALVVSLIRREKKQIKKTLIICPATAKYAVWEREIKKFTDEHCIVIDGTRKEREEAYHTFLERDDVFYLIVNYESLAIDKKYLTTFPYDSLCVCDESVYIKNRKAKRTIAVQSIKSKYKIAITGYPIANRIIDLHSQFNWLMPGLLGSFWSFQDRYLDFLTLKKHHTQDTKTKGKNCKCKKCGKWSPEQKYAFIYTCHCAQPEWKEPEFKKFLGYKNLDELKVKLEPYYIRRLKKDVLKDLPDKVYEQRDVVLSGKLLKAYIDMKEEMKLMLHNMRDEEVIAKASNIMVQMLRLSQLTCGFISDKNLEQPIFYKENPKVDLLDDLVDEVLADDNKIVIWTRFRPFLAHLYQHFTEGYKHDGEFKKHKCAYLWGRMSDKVKDDNIYMFQNDPECKIFIGMVQAGGMGITLHAATVEIFTDLSFLSPSTIEQATDRLHRLGQKNTVVVIDEIARKTVDEHWIKILGNKQKVSNMIFDDDGIVRINSKETFLSLLE